MLDDDGRVRIQPPELLGVAGRRQQSGTGVGSPRRAQRVVQQRPGDPRGGRQAERRAEPGLDPARPGRLGRDEHPGLAHRVAIRTMCHPASSEPRGLPETFDTPPARRL